MRRQIEERSYRAYVTDSLQAAGQNKYLTERWLDLITLQKRDTRSADEIALDIISRAGLRLKSDPDFVADSADGMDGEINESI